jgi:hypothetical protein
MSSDRSSQTDGAAAQAPAGPGEENWLGRWSRRKRQAAHVTEPGVADTAGVQPLEAQPPDEIMPPVVAEEPVLPPIESLDEHSDYRAFMSDKVSEELRLLALRKLFRLPQFNVTDGLNDYDGDFTAFKPLGNTMPHDMLRSLGRELQAAERGAHKQAAEVMPADPRAAQPARVADADSQVVDGSGQEDVAAGDDALPEG